ncbi:Non-specific serine/threonine protein kinase [Bertholletia excelsa]
MAFDQNSAPKDLRPLNIARTMPEETRIAPVTTSGRNVEGFYVNPPRDVGSSGSIPVCYPSAVSDAGFVGLGYGSMVPGVTGWGLMPTAAVAPSAFNSTTGYYNLNLGTRVGGNAADQPNDESKEDSVSGKRVKLLCSFGGKIMPRPSDGMLRYVGGQTRIICVRRDVSFSELVQKMADTYGQNVIIKYQLPDEDLDALVSVSCPDDLENMMDEYEKLVERSSDGSAKLRVFLFSSLELESSGIVQLGEFQDSGQRYVEAVNGMADGITGVIARKDSLTSAASTQTSDFSGADAIDSLGLGQGDVTGPPSTGVLSPTTNITTTQEPASRLVHGDPSSAVYGEGSAPLGIPVVMSSLSQSVPSQPEHELERSVPETIQKQPQIGVEMQQPGVNFQPPGPYLQPFMDSNHGNLNRADYVQIPAQMGFPTQLVGTVGPVFTHPQFHDNAAAVASHQFIPAVHMTMTPSSHINLTSGVIPPQVHPQQVQLEHHPDESPYGVRVVQLHNEQSYNAYQPQAPPAVVGGGYGWSQVPQTEQVVLSKGWVPTQQVMVPEKIPRLKDCYMCEKALPHAHSDPVVQDQKGSPASTVSDMSAIYHSLPMEDKLRAQPMNRAVATAPQEEGIIEQGSGKQSWGLGHGDQEAGKLQPQAPVQNVDRQLESDRIILQKADNPGQSKVSTPQGAVGLAVGVQGPYSVITGNLPQSCQENVGQHFLAPTQYQVKQEALMSKPVTTDMHPIGRMPLETSEHLAQESVKDYYGKLSSSTPKEEGAESCDHLRQIDGRLENLLISPSEVLISNDQSGSPVNNIRKEDILENWRQQTAGIESYVENNLSNPRIVVDPNHVKQNEFLPTSIEVSYTHNFRPVESYEVAQVPLLGNLTSYQQPKLLVSDEGLFSNPAFSGVDSIHSTERVLPNDGWKDNMSQLQAKVLPGGLDNVSSNVNMPSSLSPSDRVGNIQDSPLSLFSNQDPWSLQHDSHFPPPRPNKIAIRKEGYGSKDPFSENHSGNSGESAKGKGGELMAEVLMDNGMCQAASNANSEFGLEHSQNSKSSAEEIIKQELQAVAEGVAASVLQPPVTFTPEMILHGKNETLSEANRDSEVENSDLEVHKDIKAKAPEKMNFGFPVSDGLGRLQIISNSDLEELRELGSGTFGTVYHGKWRGTDVAIKRINDRCFAGKPSEQERMRDDFWNEAIKLADLHHPNVVAFYGVVLDGPGGSVATVTEYMVNGSLRNALQKNERNLDKRKRLLIAMDVAFGMEYLHGKNIVHFDLKSDNLLVNLRDPHRPICKVGDLGLSKVKCQTLISGGVRGTLPWMAPELLNGSSSLVSEKVDVFSFGIVLWELLTGEEPYADLHYGAIIGGIVSNTLRPPVPESCDPEWRSLMERCWSSETLERPSFTEIANELRAMAVKLPSKAQSQQQAPATQPQVKS